MFSFCNLLKFLVSDVFFSELWFNLAKAVVSSVCVSCRHPAVRPHPAAVQLLVEPGGQTRGEGLRGPDSVPLGQTGDPAPAAHHGTG